MNKRPYTKNDGTTAHDEKTTRLLRWSMALAVILVAITIVVIAIARDHSPSESARFVSCLRRHGWKTVLQPNRLLNTAHEKLITGWSAPGSLSYAEITPTSSGGHFMLVAVGGKGMPVEANEALLRSRVETDPRLFFAVLVWTRSADSGETIRSYCEFASVPNDSP